jgi:hypothetical protein
VGSRAALSGWMLNALVMLVGWFVIVLRSDSLTPTQL